VRSKTLSDVIHELWPSPMLRGMPEGTTFEHGMEGPRVWARLSTPWFPETSECEITEAETRRRAVEEGRQAFAHLCDERLSDLRMRHWMAIYWPDLDEVSS
jgi:hypothetical protein